MYESELQIADDSIHQPNQFVRCGMIYMLSYIGDTLTRASSIRFDVCVWPALKEEHHIIQECGI